MKKTEAKLLLLGYSGMQNFGDDLLLFQAYSFFKNYAKITIHTTEESENSDYLKNWFDEAEIVKSNRISFSLITSHTHVLQFGGGVFFDFGLMPTSVFIKKWLSIVKLLFIPKAFYNVRFGGIGIGLGPFNTQKAISLTQFRIKQYDFINLRDNMSLDFLNGINKTKVSVAPDLSFASLEKSNSIKHNESIKKILICPRDYEHGSQKNNYLDNLIKTANELKNKGFSVEAFAFQSNHDENVIEKFEKDGIKGEVWNPKAMNIEDVFKLFKSFDLVISARMHGVFVSGMVNVPSISIGINPKLQYASEFFANSYSVKETFNVDEIKSIIERIKHNDFKKTDFDELKNQCLAQYKFVENWLEKGNK